MNQASAASAAENGAFPSSVRTAARLIGPALLASFLLTEPPEGLEPEAWRGLGVLLWMVVWWVTEAIPIYATALLPLIAFPLLGVAPMRDAAAPYADPVIFLFIGGFIIARGFERWRLHARVALGIASRFGTHPAALLGAFMLSSALVSMWISNTATSLILMPIALGVVSGLFKDGDANRRFASALMLGVAYSATIGGIGTPIGTPPNLIALAYLERQGTPISFLDWMMMAIPVMLVMLPIAWWVLGRGLPQTSMADREAAARAFKDAMAELGPMTPAEKRLATTFALVAIAWVTRGWLVKLPGLQGISDTTIALFGALALFVIPAGGSTPARTMLMDWKTAESIPWGVAILYGGGLSAAAAMEATGLSTWMGQALTPLDALPMWAIVLCLVTIVVFVGELASNTATITSLLPLLAAVTLATQSEAWELTVPVTLAASFGFMLPVATPPNSIAYGTGYVDQRHMISVGLRLNLIGILLITVMSLLLVRLVLG